jgi:HAD superfamily hydrolase (TIGR01509 family)
VNRALDPDISPRGVSERFLRVVLEGAAAPPPNRRTALTGVMPASAVLFDIDGTLVDSNYLHIEAWGHAFADAGLAVDAWRLHRCMGMDSAKLLETLVGDAPVDRAKELHTSYYADMRPRLRAFESARELLRELDERGVTVVLATSAPEHELEMLRDVLDLEDAIAVVTSAEDVESAKPDPDIVQVALGKAEAPASEAIMIGDTRWDVEAAARAGVACIGVLSGGISAAELTEAGAIAVYDDVAHLLRELDSSPLAGS